MNSGEEISEELKSMGSALANLSRSMPYVVPAGYFDSFATPLGALISGMNTDELSPAYSKAMPFTVPAGYFEQLPEKMAAKASSAEQELNGLPRKAPYQAPAGYFEELPGKVLEAAKNTGTEKVAAGTRRFIKPLQWAAAAILVLGISIGLYDIMFKMNRSASGTDKILSSVPGNVLQEYVQRTYHLDVDNVVRANAINNMQLDNKEIIAYLNETGWD